MKLVVKIGGALLNEATRDPLLAEVLSLRGSGHAVTLIHGGGKELTSLLEQLGIPSLFRDGLRVTDAATRDAALMVYAGLVNKSVVAAVARLGGRALGLAGDAGCVAVRQRDPKLGFVGDVTFVDGDFLNGLCREGILPVLASLGLGPDGQYYNINADALAGATAAAWGADRLIFLTDVAGVLDAGGEILRRLHENDVRELIRLGTVSGGMRPKLEACLAALSQGVADVRIAGGHAPGVLKRMILDNQPEGTRLYAA